VSLINIYDVIDCNKWKREKRHECTNMGKVKWLELWWQLYLTWLLVWDLENFRPLEFCWTECKMLYLCCKYSRVYRLIYLLTAVVLTPSGSSTVHIYTQTIYRTAQLIWEEGGPCPIFVSYIWHLPYNWGESTEKPQSG